MEKTIGFNNLKVGQRVKVKGKPADGNNFSALEVSIKPGDEECALEGKIQSLEVEKNSMRLMNRDFVLNGSVEIKNVQRQPITLKNLKAGDLVKLKGPFSEATGFAPVKVKMQESKGFNIEELQGGITKIDAATKTLEVLGFTIIVNDKTEIEGF
ncbi:MAG: hypothetical protein ALAOOOJD_01404 [bacterium]|nr:hypothetical protein [bacterium]